MSSALDRGREAYGRAAWAESFDQLSTADAEQSLDPEDLVRLATAAHLLGRPADSAELWTRAHQEFISRGNPRGAARCAAWLAVPLLFRGELALAGGWLSRGQRLLDEGRHDCVERGYLLFPLALQSILQGDNAAAYTTFGEAAALGERFHDPDLLTFARQGQGRALLRLGEVARGVALLDEAMIAITAGDVSPMVAGDVYCSVIEACHEVYDLRRAQEWTAAMARWCETQADRVPYRGHCLIRRAEIQQLHGDWPDAMDTAQRAQEWLLRPPAQRAVGAAFYRAAELFRLRGAWDQAVEAYKQASHWGLEPQPGLAQLRLAMGQTEAARSAICRALGEAKDSGTRARILPPYVEIMLTGGDVAAARTGADELSNIAGDLDAPLLHALASQAQGAVMLAEGDPGGALTALRRALSIWQALEAPYEAAKVRVLTGLACRELGDEDAAELEIDAANRTFEQLGAMPDRSRASTFARHTPATPPSGLTAREVQVLGLVATGKTNRAIARELGISEKTVARHLSNIFVKLGISSRAAATAYAYQHQLV